MGGGEPPDAAARREEEAAQLAGLVGARICHDLVSPLGAIGNGIELLALGGGTGEAELALVSGSVAEAAARLRFFRLVFGAGGADQAIGRTELAALIAGAYGSGRVTAEWSGLRDLPRAEARLGCLLIQCAESGLPRGGRVRIAPQGRGWRLGAEGPRLREDPALWGLLAGGPVPAELRAAEVQFALAPRVAAALGRRIAVALGDGVLSLGF